MKINTFESARAQKPTDTVSVDSILEAIQNGLFKDQIEKLRKIDREDDEEAYSDAKKKLPAVTFSGTFDPTRTDANLVEHSGFMCLDWDHLEEDQMDDLKIRLEQNKYIYAYFESPGGEGIKALVKTQAMANAEVHKSWYERLLMEFSGADPANSNVARLCFMSYDPELFFNKDSHVFGYETDSQIIKETIKSTKSPQMGASNETKFSVFDPPIKGHRDDQLLAAARVRFNNGQSFADVMRDTMNQNLAGNHPLPEADIDRIVNQAHKYHGVEDEEKTEEEIEDLDAILKKSLINHKTKVDPPVPIVQYTMQNGTQFDYYNLLTLGNFSLIKGWKGAKKTALTSALISIAMGDNTRDQLIGGLPEGKEFVVYIDTEQYESETKIVFDRIHNDVPNSKNFMSFNFREHDYMMRCDLIDRILERADGKVGMIIIDGISDLSRADNDEDEATRVTQLLMTWTSVYKCHVVAVIHTNKGRDDATGWLGSKVEKKSSAVIKVEKDTSIGESVVINDKNRHAMEFLPFVIRIEGNKVVFDEKPDNHEV